MAIILAIFGILNDLNVVVVDNNTTNYLNELDFMVEIPETKSISNTSVFNQNDNVFSRFLNLFNNDHNGYWSNIAELKNVHYMNNIKTINCHNKIEWLDICKKYTYVSAQNKEILFFIDCFTDILNDLEAIKDDLSKAQ